ncbi:MAG: glycerophosphodiester phosphodiesterase family protein [Microbacteriaceae bacterium]
MRQPKAYFSLPSPRVIAHRGLSLDVPENTIASFTAAATLGVSHIETDVHASSDGVAIISHDSLLERVAARPGSVADFTARELSTIDLGGGFGFPTLTEALDALPDTFFNIDVKSAGAINPTVRAINDAGAIDRVLITSFSERRRAATVRRLPGVATSASGAIFAAALFSRAVGLTPLARAVVSKVDAVQVPTRAAGLQTTTSGMISLLHKAGLEIHVWTINDPVHMLSLLRIGVDGIVTDRADLALAVVREFAP